MSTHVLYVDESGNVGVDYSNKEQPFHVAAGWLIAETGVDALHAAVRRLQGQRAQEVKASSLLRRDSGLARANVLMKEIGAAGGLPFFIIMERRFSLVGRFVATFFDSSHNPASAWLSPNDAGANLALTEFLLESLGEGVLDAFAKAYRAPSVVGFRAVIIAAKQGMPAHGYGPKVVSTLESALRHLTAIVEAETYGMMDGKPSAKL